MTTTADLITSTAAQPKQERRPRHLLFIFARIIEKGTSRPPS